MQLFIRCCIVVILNIDRSSNHSKTLLIQLPREGDSCALWVLKWTGIGSFIEGSNQIAPEEIYSYNSFQSSPLNILLWKESVLSPLLRVPRSFYQQRCVTPLRACSTNLLFHIAASHDSWLPKQRHMFMWNLTQKSPNNNRLRGS